jgi:hypothetical protein
MASALSGDGRRRLRLRHGWAARRVRTRAPRGDYLIPRASQLTRTFRRALSTNGRTIPHTNLETPIRMLRRIKLKL